MVELPPYLIEKSRKGRFSLSLLQEDQVDALALLLQDKTSTFSVNAERLREDLKLGQATMLVAKDTKPGQLIGFLRFHWEYRSGNIVNQKIEHLLVKSAARGKGVGSALLDASIAILKQKSLFNKDTKFQSSLYDTSYDDLDWQRERTCFSQGERVTFLYESRGYKSLTGSSILTLTSPAHARVNRRHSIS